MSSRSAHSLTSTSPSIGTIAENDCSSLSLFPSCSLQTQGLNGCHLNRVRHCRLPSRGSLSLYSGYFPPSCFAPCHFVRLVLSWRQFTQPRGMTVEVAPLSEEGPCFSSPMYHVTHSGARVSSQVATLFPSPALPLLAVPVQTTEGCGAGLCLLNLWVFSLFKPSHNLSSSWGTGLTNLWYLIKQRALGSVSGRRCFS